MVAMSATALVAMRYAFMGRLQLQRCRLQGKLGAIDDVTITIKISSEITRSGAKELIVSNADEPHQT
jgi:hypothetical protein